MLYLLSVPLYSVTELGSLDAPTLVEYISLAYMQEVASLVGSSVEPLDSYRALGPLFYLPSGLLARTLTEESACFPDSRE